MAEEKKTTTRKTTKKTEEVVVEKRFCPDCGKELKEGESCNCKETGTNPAVTVNTDAMVKTAKSFWNTILNVFKKPDTTITEETKKKESTISVITIVVLAITFAFYLMATISSSAKSIDDVTLGLTTIVTTNISYFKVFIYGILMYALMAVIPMFAAFVIGKITKSKITFKKAFQLYAISNAPMVLVFLVMTLVLLINVSLLNGIGMIGMAIVEVFCFFNFILSVNKELMVREDRKSWALTSLVVVWVATLLLAFVIILSSVASDMIKKPSNQNNNYNDIFNW